MGNVNRQLTTDSTDPCTASISKVTTLQPDRNAYIIIVCSSVNVYTPYDKSTNANEQQQKLV